MKPWALNNRLARLARKLVVGIPSELWRWLKALKTLWGTDALVIPGTGLLTDAWGLLGGWGPYDLFKWSLTAKLCRCKVFFVSVGAGPLYSRAGRFFVKEALSLADFRSYRHESSQRYLTAIGFWGGNDRVYPDLAYSLPASMIPRRDQGEGRRLIVGLGLMEYAGMYGGPTGAEYAGYLDSLVSFAEWPIAFGHDIRLLIGDLGDRSVTWDFSELLKKRIPAAHEGHVMNDPISCVEDLLAQLAGTDVVVATRFHNALLALRLNKPVISISFHHKCSSLMSEMGLSDYCQDINGLTAEGLIEKFRALETNTRRLKDLIKQKTDECARALDEQYDLILRELNVPVHEPCLSGEVIPWGKGDLSQFGASCTGMGAASCARQVDKFGTSIFIGSGRTLLRSFRAWPHSYKDTAGASLRWKYAWMKPLFGWLTAKWAQAALPQLKASYIRRWDKAVYRFETGRRREI